MASSAAENRKKIEEALNRNATIPGSNPNRGLPSRPVSTTAVGKLARAQQEARMRPTAPSPARQKEQATTPIIPPYQPSPGIFKAKTEKIPTPKGIPDLPTSNIPVEDPEELLAPPPPGVKNEKEAEKLLADRYKNFQKLRDAQRKQRIQNLTNLQQLGYNAANIFRKATGPAVDRVSSWPSPGGLLLPLLVLGVLVLLLLPVNGETRIVWLWKTLTGTASINPYAKPPETQFSVRNQSQGAGQQGGGSLPQGQAEQQFTGYDEGHSDTQMPWYTTYIPSTSTYDEW